MLRADDSGDENVMKAFIMVFALILLLTFVIGGLTRLGTSGSISEGIYTGGPGIDIYQYEVLTADSGDGRYILIPPDLQGYQVTSADTIDQVCYPTYEDPFKFNGSDQDMKYVHVIRDNVRYDPDSIDLWEMYNDFFSIRRESTGLVEFASWSTLQGWDDAAIPFSVCAENYNNETYLCILNFTVGGRTDNLMLRTPTADDADEFLECLYNDNYTIHYGWSLLRMDESSFWGTLGMIFWSEIPGMNPYVEFIFHAFMIGVVAFVIFIMAVRLYDAVVPL